MTYSPICYACNKDIQEDKEPFYYCVQRNHVLRTDQEMWNDEILDGLELLAFCTECIYRAMSVQFRAAYEPLKLLELERKELARFARWYTNGTGKWTPINDSQLICSICKKPIPLLDEYTRTEISVDVLIKDNEVRSEEDYLLVILCNDCSNTFFDNEDETTESDSGTQPFCF